ncbi:hypothetical protein [Streptomyces sp. NPDC101115]|uniref:hypothetical protein n=1 Tax=Streptomyces sp. NPDC101115 TaxID=3366106 RepID=UPI00381F439D
MVNDSENTMGTAVLLAAAPAGRGRAMDAASVLPALAAVPAGVLAGSDMATIVELADPLDPQTVLTRLRAAAATPGPLALYLAGQVQLDRRQRLPHLALARSTPTTLRYTGLPWHWLTTELAPRRPGTTHVVADLAADPELWQRLASEPGTLALGPGVPLYARVTPFPRRGPLLAPDYLRHFATLWRSGARPPLPALHAEASAAASTDHPESLFLTPPALPVQAAPAAAVTPAPGAPVQATPTPPVQAAPAAGVTPMPGPPVLATPAAAGMPIPAAPVKGGPAAAATPPSAARADGVDSPRTRRLLPRSAQARPGAGQAPQGPPPSGLDEESPAVATAVPPAPAPMPAPAPEPMPVPVAVPAPASVAAEAVTATPRAPEPPNGAPGRRAAAAPSAPSRKGGLAARRADVKAAAVRAESAVTPPRPVEAPGVGAGGPPRPGSGADPHPAILAAAMAGRHAEAAAVASAWESDALRRYGPRSGEALHWVEVRADLARLAGEPARSCELWIAAAQARLGLRQGPDEPDVEGAVDRAHHQWEQITDPARARALGPALVELRRAVPGRHAGALAALQRRMGG